MIKLKDILTEANQEMYQIYCDMDGVLADFEKQFERHTGHKVKGFQTKNGKDAFWAEIQTHGVKFWSDIPWMSDGKTLWKYIKKFNPSILSAPSQAEESKIGKTQWVKKNIGNVKLILIRSSEKQKYANQYAILIDDYERNIQRWKSTGGIAILHTSTANTIAQLKKLGL